MSRLPKRLRGYSLYGCGVMLLGLRRDETGVLQTTRWLTFLYMPVLPFSRWRVEYVGREGGEYQDDETLVFWGLERLSLDLEGVSRTLLAGWFLGAVAVGPAVAAAVLVKPPVPAWLFAGVITTAVWPLAVILWVQRRWRKVAREGARDAGLGVDSSTDEHHFLS